MKLTQRIREIPPYLFATIDEKKAAALAAGVDIIDLGIGDPDLPTPEFIVDAMCEAVRDPSTHNYPPYQGTLDFRRAVANWYHRRFGVQLDPGTEVISLIGSKEGLAHACLTFLDPGDTALIPDPGYPAYEVNCRIAGAKPVMVPVSASNGYQVDVSAIPSDLAREAKLLFLNYPGNPTGAVADDAHFEAVIAWATQYDVLICMDLAYSEVYYDGHRPRSILEFHGARDVAIEFHSLSKTFNMTGWRIGMAVGHAPAVQALGKIKTNMDSGVFKAVQRAGIVALDGADRVVDHQNAIYQRRRDIICDGFQGLGWTVARPKATFYVWLPVPVGMNSTEFTMYVLEKTGVLVVPGTGYGPHGEGYFRISITSPEVRLRLAIDRLRASNIHY